MNHAFKSANVSDVFIIKHFQNTNASLPSNSTAWRLAPSCGEAKRYFSDILLEVEELKQNLNLNIIFFTKYFKVLYNQTCIFYVELINLIFYR